jgi:Spy/CpxP family protein refolding chaperone
MVQKGGGNMKKAGIAILAVVITLGLLQSVSLAEKQCGHGGQGHSAMSVKEKFFKKIHMIYLYQDELGVSDEQMQQIKDLKIGLKKDMIAAEADIDVIKIDIQSLLYTDTIDVDAINKLIDQKYETKKAKSKKTVAAYATLKKILTKDQLDKMEDIYHEKKKTHAAHGSWKGSKKH